MIVTLASVKGGVGKSTCAIHIAAYLRSLSSTLLIDSDRIRSCVAWSKRGKLPFPVVDENHQAKAMRDTRYEYVVFDTPGSIDDQGLMELADGCDLMIVPAVPESSATDGLLYTLRRIQRGKGEFGVLLNRVRHNRPQEATELREAIAETGARVFTTEIPDLVAFDKASAQGVPVYDVDDRRAARAWEAFEALGKEITNG
jgi:chromosome partitioning protein